MTIKLGWYGDDFTGATDTLAVAARAGWRTLLFLGVPAPAHLASVGQLDAIGIAGSARTMTPVQMQDELAPVGAFFKQVGVSVLLYKCCSTFDSSPELGSIGAAVDVLRPYVFDHTAYIVGGQPEIGRYCCFGNLFAAVTTNGPVYRIDRHDTMKRHPVTPMCEADLRVHLQRQGLHRVQSVCYPDYQNTEEIADQRTDALIGDGADMADAVLFDVAQQADLVHVGRQILRRARQRPVLAVGPSSVLDAIAACGQPRMRSCNTDSRAAKCVDGRRGGGKSGGGSGATFVFVGSMSPVTQRQVDYCTSYIKIPLSAHRLVYDGDYVGTQCARIAVELGANKPVLAHVVNDVTEASPIEPSEMARITADFVRRVVQCQAQCNPLRQLGIAGGDTSSLAAKTLGIWALAFDAVLAPGVTVCRARSDDARLDGLRLMLKGGQMGGVDIFEIFLVR